MSSQQSSFKSGSSARNVSASRSGGRSNSFGMARARFEKGGEKYTVGDSMPRSSVRPDQSSSAEETLRDVDKFLDQLHAKKIGSQLGSLQKPRQASSNALVAKRAAKSDGPTFEGPVEDEKKDSDRVNMLVSRYLGTETSKRLPHPPSSKVHKTMKSYDEWELRDIASEETEKATGRTRPGMTGPRARSKIIKSMLSDDTSFDQTSASERIELEEQSTESSDEIEAQQKRPDPDGSVNSQDMSDLVLEFLQHGSMDQEEGLDLVQSTEELDVTYSHESYLLDTGLSEEDNAITDNTLDEEVRGFLEHFAALEIDEENESITDVTADEGASYLHSPATEGRDTKYGNPISLHGGEESPIHSPATGGHDSKDDDLISIQGGEESPVYSPATGGHDSKYGNLISLQAIAEFFATLEDSVNFEDREEATKFRHFQKMVAPAISGQRPSIIEAAQIRQAAQRTKVPMEVVDRFLDFADHLHADVPQVPSDIEFHNFASLDDVENINEDAAIAAFVSLNYGEHNSDAKGDNEETVEVDGTFGNDQTSLASQEEEEKWWKGVSPRKNKEQMQPQIKYSDANKFRNASFKESEVGSLSITNVEDDQPGTSERPISILRESRLSTPKKRSITIFPMPVKTFGYNSRLDESTWVLKKSMATDVEGWEKHSKQISEGWEKQTKKISEGWEKHSKQLSEGWEKHSKQNSGRRRPPVPKSEEASSNGVPALNGVAVSKKLGRFARIASRKRLFPTLKPWKLPNKERTELHGGYIGIDIYSIYESAVIGGAEMNDQEFTPWEHREVKQGFFHERSIAYQRNWFGSLVQSRGNRKYSPPVCEPKSMEMPMENIPDPGEWTEEWYKTWKSPGDPHLMPDSASSADQTEDDFSVEEEDYSEGSHSSSYSGSDDSSDDVSWEENPECGTIINVKQKIGERVTRVHPDFTCSLRRSRWRKKYFPRGTFPY